MHRILLNNWLIVLLALLLGTVTPVFAEVDETEILGLTEPADPSIVSTSHFPRPTSKTAENITVITAEEIARLNAHTLADVLQTVPGIQLDYVRTPGSFTFFNIQGAFNTTILVMIDGVRQNDFKQNMAVPGLIPVQNIERIEIIKGAGSSSWGSALGGVINIITKAPNPDRVVSGTVSGSVGSKFTTDSRGELSGAINRLGYYLSLGQLHSDGLHANTANDMNSAYGKVTLQLPNDGKLTAGFSYLTAHPGLGQEWLSGWSITTHDNNIFRRSSGFLTLNQPLATNLNLDINANFSNRSDQTIFGELDNIGAVIIDGHGYIRESRQGVNSRLAWGDSQLSLLAGFEYYYTKSNAYDLLDSTYDYAKRWDSWGLYVNGSYSIGKFTIIPSFRHDITGIAGETTSYSLGGTYQLAESTTLRTYYGNGFSLPILDPTKPKDPQKIKTIQAGIETGAVPFIWLKGTYYRNTLNNCPVIPNQVRQGFELEARTVPVQNISLATGYTFLYATNSDTGERLKTNAEQTVPPHLFKLSAIYNNSNSGLTGTLTGNYVYWPKDPNGTLLTASSGMVWDLHLNWKINPKSDLSPELFFSGRNLFNNLQTTDTELTKNNSRWFEGGARFRF